MTGGLTPKVKKSRSRTRSRRAQWMKLKPVNTSTCDRCRQPKLQHSACQSCGWYRGREYPEAIIARD
jgi:large subunit ribosomal protein L32